MIKILLVLLALTFTSTASAANEITLTLASKHLVQDGYLRDHKYNEINPGVGYYFERQNVEVGAYVNSYAGLALYAGRRYKMKYLDLGYGMLLYDNFKWEKDNLNLSPFIMVSKDIGQFRIGYSPMIRKNSRDKWTYGVFTLQYFIPQ